MLTVSFAIISILVLALIAGGLIVNRPPVMDPPGLWARLLTYLGTHVAETRPDHPFPELRSRFYALPPDRLYAVTREAIAGLGWGIASEDPASLCLTAVVESALWRFKDDVVVRAEPRKAAAPTACARAPGLDAAISPPTPVICSTSMPPSSSAWW